MRPAYTALDRLIIQFDKGLRTQFGKPPITGRARPDDRLEEAELSAQERRETEGLLRVNHVGEVCAQALYQGQALTARDPVVKRRMEQSAWEENDHLHWCEARLQELGGRTSYLNPFWYTGSLGIGLLAGIISDRLNLGFVAETERQVVKHLDSHLQRLPEQDAKSRAIVTQMKEDEARHATIAIDSGAIELPEPIKRLMTACSRVMTTVAYWL